MPWPWIIVAIAVAGLLMLVFFGIWLMHKASDVLAELRVLAQRAGQGIEVLEQLRLPGQDGGYAGDLEWESDDFWRENRDGQPGATAEDHDPDAATHRPVPTT